MAVFWKKLSAEETWSPVVLDEQGAALAQDAASTAPEAGANASPLVMAAPNGDWTLLSPAGTAVWANGDPVLLGIRVLRDRDVIRAGGENIVFSSESLCAVVPFPAGGRRVMCARCQTAIESGEPAVRCPRCRRWHHQDPSAERGCWTYDDRCQREQCDQPTALDGTYQWSPEGVF